MVKKKSKVQEALSDIADFVSTFVTTLIVIVAVAAVVIRVIGWNMFTVDSYSMTPAYPINSLIIVETVDPEEIQVGDVITFVVNEDGLLVTHRVTAIDRSNQTFTTKGDANETEDASPVLWSNVVGRVFIGIPYLGTPMRYLTAEENRPIVIGVIVGLLVISVARDIVSWLARKRKAVTAPDEDVTEETSTAPAASASDGTGYIDLTDNGTDVEQNAAVGEEADGKTPETDTRIESGEIGYTDMDQRNP